MMRETSKLRRRAIAALLLAVGLALTEPCRAETLPQALVIVGPWGDLFGWREALHDRGVWYDEAYRATNVYHGGTRIYGLPPSVEGLSKYSTIVLANVDALTLGEKMLPALRDFVAGGGGLVVLGGEWAFARGGYRGTPLEEMLPVTIPVEDRIPSEPSGAALAKGPSSPWEIAADFAASPRSFYTQTLVPRDGANVAVTAGDRPAIIVGRHGKGRVVAVALTVHGDQTAGQTAFWQWRDWPRLLGQAVEWSTVDARPTTGDAKSLKPLGEEEIDQVKFRFQKMNDDFVARFAASPSAPAAAAVFEQLFADEPARVTISPSLVDGLARFAEPAWGKRLQKWSDSLNPQLDHRSTALELLGATRSEGAAATLLPLIDNADVGSAALDGLSRLGDAGAISKLRETLDRHLAKADFRNPDGVKSNGPTAQRSGAIAVHAAAALYALGDAEGPSRMASLYREIRLLRRIFANAAKRRVGDADPTGQAIRKAIIEKTDDLRRLEAFLLAKAGPIPTSQQQAFVDFAKRVTDEAEVRWAATALMQSEASSWSALASAEDGIIRRLASSPPAK